MYFVSHFAEFCIRSDRFLQILSNSKETRILLILQRFKLHLVNSSISWSWRVLFSSNLSIHPFPRQTAIESNYKIRWDFIRTYKCIVPNVWGKIGGHLAHDRQVIAGKKNIFHKSKAGQMKTNEKWQSSYHLQLK